MIWTCGGGSEGNPGKLEGQDPEEGQRDTGGMMQGNE